VWGVVGGPVKKARTGEGAGSMRLLFSALMKTGSTAAGKEGPVILTSAKELSSFSYFQRSGFAEMCTFFCRTFAKNQNAAGARTSVKQQGYQCHMYVSPFGVTAACFADDEYPARVAFGYLSRLCEVFAEATGGHLPTSNEDNCVSSFQVYAGRACGRCARPYLCHACSKRQRSLLAVTTRHALFLSPVTGAAPETASAIPGPIAG
jgi:hypothetical protein